MTRHFRRRAVCTVLAAVLWLSPFAPFVRADDAALRPHVVAFDEDADEKPGIDFRLSEVKSAAPATERVPMAPAEKLPEAETAALLARLPAQRPPAPEEPFRFPPPTVPPPKTGNVLPLLKPSTEAVPVRQPVAPLEVVRFAPNGYMAVAPNLTVTFSQPMIPVGSAESAVVTNPPVELTPQPPGRWRWLDTRTLRFEPEGRFPMATEYAVRIPAGMRSALGGQLPTEIRRRFVTPDPVVESVSGTSRPMRRNPVIAVRFNQRVIPENVLGSVWATANGVPVTVTLATQAEITADVNAGAMLKDAPPGYAVAFRLAGAGGRPLPSGAKGEMTISAGMPSAEGPRRKERDQAFTFSVYGPLRVVDHDCDECYPWYDFPIRFSQPLRDFDPSWVTVEPKISDLSIEADDDTITIGGLKQPLTTYRVTLSPKIRGEFGGALRRAPRR